MEHSIETISNKELLLMVKKEIEDDKKRTEWGRWKYNKENLTIYTEPTDNGWEYEIDLERVRDYSDVIDWLAHLKEKNWISTKDLGDLFAALDDISGGLRSSRSFSWR